MLDPWHRPMRTTRLRIAVLGCIAPCMIAMLSLNREDGSIGSGPIWGRVTYNGRPLEQGAVLFVPIEAEPIDWAIGPIDKDGRYAIDSRWCRGRSEKVRFRVCIVPFPYTVTPEHRSSSPGEVSWPNIDPASLPRETPDSRPQKLVNLPVPERFMRIWTSGLEVTLDRESARVDVDLKD